MKPEKEEGKEPKGGLAIVIGGGKPAEDKPGVFLPKEILGDHFEGLSEGKEYKVTLKVKVVGKDDEGADATILEVQDVDSAGDEFGGTEGEDEEENMDDRFKKHAEKDEGEDTPDGFAGGMKG